MASWFKRRDSEEPDESTIEVKARVIADAVRAAEQQQQPPRQVGPQAGIAADGLVSGGDFAEPDAPQPTAAAVAFDQALAERKSLVQLCLYALDRAKSPGVVERLEEGLAGVGVAAIRPDGARFDPAHHEAGGTVATTDESLDGVVAETEVVGFSDRGEVLRAPIVTVYSKGQS
ncbi:nucleotide exchange factor GrpE [Actinophytocola oryzae]|uniref:GrpE protein n=1 Tax=Actinophytocola oryzae TaxID=502181 RepID=A0A4R7VMD1_9PSEU|nr:nucleotide exchange factor GrpE [Actinophytocola oryzae]TDV50760.1 GrpE protein [Actinophytocola oryzae]